MAKQENCISKELKKSMKKNDSVNTIKKRHSFFVKWEFDAAAEEFNKMSEQGWHLVRCKPFTQTYAYDPTSIYKYQIDCNDRVADPTRYLQTFAEAGWIPVMSNWGGWHIFAKKYVPGQPEETYMIYTDGQSRKEMLRRSRRLVGFIAVLWVICLLYGVYRVITGVMESGKSDMTVCWTPVLQALNVYLFSRWYFSVRSLEKGKKPRRFHFVIYVAIAAAVIVASLVSFLI